MVKRLIAVVASLAMLLVAAAPAGATTKEHLSGPDPAVWLSDPDGVDGTSGIEQGDPVVGSRGQAAVSAHGARIQVKATGLVPGHVYTMWIVYFNDKTACSSQPCAFADLSVAGAGGVWGDGLIAGSSGNAVFSGRLRDGAAADLVGETPPPPFAFAAYDAGSDNEFHVLIRSHGPPIPGEVHSQLTTFGGGCDVIVGPAPEEVGDFPVPSAPGECGEIQLYVFS